MKIRIISTFLFPLFLFGYSEVDADDVSKGREYFLSHFLALRVLQSVACIYLLAMLS